MSSNNLIYLFLGYGVFLGGVALYLLSLALRRRALSRDEQTLQQIRQQIEAEKR